MGSAVSHVDEVQGRLGLRAGHSFPSQRVFRPTDSRAIKGKMVGCVPKAKGKGHGRHKENRETTFICLSQSVQTTLLPPEWFHKSLYTQMDIIQPSTISGNISQTSKAIPAA